MDRSLLPHLPAVLAVALLPETAIWEPGLFVYFPRHAAQAAKLRAFLEAARTVRETAARERGREAFTPPSA